MLAALCCDELDAESQGLGLLREVSSVSLRKLQISCWVSGWLMEGKVTVEAYPCRLAYFCLVLL